MATTEQVLTVELDHSPTSDAPDVPECCYFKRGLCKFGENLCRYKHNNVTNLCQFGTSCYFFQNHSPTNSPSIEEMSPIAPTHYPITSDTADQYQVPPNYNHFFPVAYFNPMLLGYQNYTPNIVGYPPFYAIPMQPEIDQVDPVEAPAAASHQQSNASQKKKWSENNRTSYYRPKPQPSRKNKIVKQSRKI